VFELTICLLHHLQLHMHSCAALQWLYVQCSSSATDAMFACIWMQVFCMCVILHAQIIYNLVSVWRERNFHTFRPYDVISGLMTSHPWQINTSRLRTVWSSHVSMI